MRWLSLGLLYLSACSATLLESPAHGRGVVGYSTAGLPPVVQARHDDAIAQMEHACHGPYTIMREDAADEGSIEMTSPNLDFVYPQDYTYVTFACVPNAANATSARY